jgi:hypothetical protein
LKERQPLHKIIIPPLLDKERGIKGVRLMNDLSIFPRLIIKKGVK